jgi:hypothetical protein
LMMETHFGDEWVWLSGSQCLPTWVATVRSLVSKELHRPGVYSYGSAVTLTVQRISYLYLRIHLFVVCMKRIHVSYINLRWIFSTLSQVY